MEREKYYLTHEERPIIEFPALLKSLMIFLSVCLGASLLFLPWYIVLILFTGFYVTIGIILNPFIGILLFLVSTYVHFMVFAPVALVRYQPAVIAGVVILLAWIFHIMIFKDFKLPKTSQLFCIFGFGFLTFFSVIFYFHQYDSFFLVLNLAKVLILYFLVINLIKTEKQLFIVLGLILILSFYSALYGLIQSLSGNTSEAIERLVGLEENPNYFSMNLVLLIPLILGLFQYCRSWIIKFGLITTFILFLLAISFTFSRAGFLGLIIVLLISFWKFFATRNKFFMAIIFLLIILLVLPFLPEEYWERVQSITNLKDVSIRGRIDGFRVGLQMMLDHPFLGVGHGRWSYEYRPTMSKMVGITTYAWCPHNVFIEVGAQTGFVALIFFVFIVLFSFKELREAERIFEEKNNSLLSVVSQSFTIGLIGFLVCAMFAAAAELKIFWIIIGLSVVLKEIALMSENKIKTL